jgi:hypothetical protein
MANSNAPFGLRPLRHRTGANFVANQYAIASAYDTDIFMGDVVELVSTSNNIEKPAAGNVDNLGVFAGCRYVNSSGKPVWGRYWPADTVASDIEAYVWDDPWIIFEAQADTLAVTDIGALADINLGTGVAATGISGAYIDVGAGTGTTGKTFRIERLSRGTDQDQNNAVGAYAKVEVTFAEHVRMNVVSGVGGI